MRLTVDDVRELDNKIHESKFNVSESELSQEDDIESKEVENYSLNWTLRKCSSKLFDQISALYPRISFEQATVILDIYLQNKDWIKK